MIYKVYYEGIYYELGLYDLEYIDIILDFPKMLRQYLIIKLLNIFLYKRLQYLQLIYLIKSASHCILHTAG